MIDTHDFEVKLKSARRFLEDGNKVKFTLKFRGREMSYQDQGLDVLNRIKEELAALGKVEQEPKLEGKSMGMLIGPVSSKQKKAGFKPAFLLTGLSIFIPGISTFATNFSIKDISIDRSVTNTV